MKIIDEEHDIIIHLNPRTPACGRGQTFEVEASDVGKALAFYKGYRKATCTILSSDVGRRVLMTRLVEQPLHYDWRFTS